MNRANSITFSRIILTLPFIVFLFTGKTGVFVSLFVFIFASLSDWVDGYIAREKNQITDIGKIMDPVADKVLVFGALVVFVYMHIVPFWIVIILIARDFLVMALRVELAKRQIILAAIFSAKVKTVAEYAGIFACLFYLLFSEPPLNLVFKWLIFVFLGIAVVFALFSAIKYFLQAKKVFDW